MKGWFGPLPGTNAGYSGVWVTYNVMPVRWQGWLITLVYFAVQIGAAFFTATVLKALGWSEAGWSVAWFVVQLTVLHLVYLWIASRHYVSWAEMDPSVLPSDMRGKRSGE